MHKGEVMPLVTFFHRKPRSVGNYSVEFIFEDVRQKLKSLIISKLHFSRYESNGLFKRLYNCLDASRNQSQVNHVTGDINYIGLFLSKKNTIHTILDCVFMTASSGLKRDVLKYFWLTVPVRRSRFITAISESTKNEILKYTQCEPEKIKVIYVAISDRFKKVDKAFNKAKPIILQIGTAPNKNIPRLIESLKGIPCELHIVGRRDEEYIRLLEENKISYSYESGLDDQQMLKKYEESDIISLVSTYEGFGMPILEAQAVGRPVITSNVYSMPEVAGDSTCLVDPLDVKAIREGIQRIIGDDDFRDDLIRKGFENIRRFHSEKIALEYYGLYKQIGSN